MLHAGPMTSYGAMRVAAPSFGRRSDFDQSTFAVQWESLFPHTYHHGALHSLQTCMRVRHFNARYSNILCVLIRGRISYYTRKYAMSDRDSGIWRTPDDVLRNLKARKRNLQKRFQIQRSQSDVHTANPSLLDSQFQNPRIANVNSEHTSKRRNPFRASPNKKQKSVSAIEDCDTSDNSLFQLLHFSNSKVETPEQDDVFVEHNLEVQNLEKENENTVEWKSTLPIDWSLKTSLRFTSDKPFPWNGRLTTAEAASGVTGFVRCHPLVEGDVEYALDTSPRAQLHQCCQFWMHPYIPWLRMFPRHGAKGSAQGVALDVTEQKALQAEWAKSFESVFNLLRARQCPYFYLCGPTFTVLFRAAGIDGISNIHALLTPTTVGLREALRHEGVDFKTPLLQDKGDNSKIADARAENGALLEDEDIVDDEEPMSWLQSMGIASEEFALKMAANKINKDSSFASDHRPSSLIYVEDCNVQALFNFLLNSKCCTSASGSLAGVPATLLAPTAFLGSSLQSLKVQQHAGVHLAKQIYTLDVTGPILPHTVQYLASLLRQVHDNVTMSSTPLEPTSSLAESVGHEEPAPETLAAFCHQNLTDCGLWPTVLRQMCTRRNTMYIHEATFSNRQIHCTALTI